MRVVLIMARDLGGNLLINETKATGIQEFLAQNAEEEVECFNYERLFIV